MDTDIINAEQALRRLNQDQALYTQLLRSFWIAQADAVHTVRALLRAGAADEAARHVNTLRGAAGIIGAGALQHTAGDLETCLKDSAAAAARVDQLITATGRLLLATMDRIASVLGREGLSPSPPGSGTDKHDMRTCFAELEARLEACNREAVRWVNRFASDLRGLGMRADTSALEQHVRACDLAGALSELRRLWSALGERDGAAPKLPA